MWLVLWTAGRCVRTLTPGTIGQWAALAAALAAAVTMLPC